MVRPSAATGTTTIHCLVERYGLTPGAGAQLERLVELLASDPSAPTAITDRGRIVADHIADSLVALDVDQVVAATTMADLGSGAGLPGLVLAIGRPRMHVSLVESSRRKCAFLERAATSADTGGNVSVVCSRAEDWSAGIGTLDLVTARAVAPLPVVIEYAAPLLVMGGALVVWRGKLDPVADGAASRAAALLGMERAELRRVRPYPEARHRHLDLLVKARATPPGFPRRAGMALKRPLGSG